VKTFQYLLSNMDIIDRDIEAAEQEASPENYPLDQTAHTTTGTAFESSSKTLLGFPGLQARKSHPTELDRISTYRTIHSSTVGAQASSRGNTRLQKVTTLGAGKVFAPADYNVEDFLVEFDGHDDPLHPQNWPMRKRWTTYYHSYLQT
jgi:DHA1 family multidrug resistance protein-like MFS transporter